MSKGKQTSKLSYRMQTKPTTIAYLVGTMFARGLPWGWGKKL